MHGLGTIICLWLAAEAPGPGSLLLPIDPALAGVTADQLADWAADHGRRIWRQGTLIGIRAPLRAEGGRVLDRAPAFEGLCRKLIAGLPAEDREVLVTGRVLLLDRGDRRAHDLLRAAWPAGLTSPARLGFGVVTPDAVGRTRLDADRAADGLTPLHDREWEPIARRLADEQRLAEQAGALPWRAGLSAGLVLFARLVDADGRPASGEIEAFSSLPPLDDDLFAAWDERCLVSLGQGQAFGGRDLAAAWLAAERRPAPVVELAAGAYSLAQLAQAMSGTELYRVDPAYAAERVTVDAARVPVADLATGLQFATGLSWRRTGDEAGPAWTLAAAPADIVAAESAAADDELWADAVAETVLRDEGETFAEYADPTAPGRRRVPWRELTTAQQTWLLDRLEQVTAGPDGSPRTTGRPVAEELASGCSLNLEPRGVLLVGWYAQLSADDGTTVFWRATASSYRLKPFQPAADGVPGAER